MLYVPCSLLTNTFVSSRTSQFVDERPECAQSNAKLLRHRPYQTLFHIISNRKMSLKVFLQLSCCTQFKVKVRADQVFKLLKTSLLSVHRGDQSSIFPLLQLS